MAEAVAKEVPQPKAPEPVQTAAAPNPFGGFGPPPQMGATMTFREVGQSGLRAFGGYVREEFLYQLQGRQGATIYREMADNSPVIGALMFAIQSTMKKVEWRTVPADDTPAGQEMADFADSLREDMSHTWEEFIIEGLSMLTYGYAPMELVYKRRLGQNPGADPENPGQSLPTSRFDDGRIGWRRIPLRGQDTVIRWFFNPNGDPLGLTQQPWVGPLLDIPIEKLLLFRPTHAKNNPEGRSILRNAYRSYWMTKRIEEQEAILWERMNGIPVIKVPQQLMEAAKSGDGNSQAAMNMFKAMVINLRIDEQMGIILPSDTFPGPTGPSAVPMYSFELVSPGGAGGRAAVTPNEVLTRHATNMLMAVLADFIMLGHDQHGTQALGVSKVDMFFQAIEAFLNGMASVVNRHGLARLWKLNGLDPDLQPEYQPDLAQRVDLDLLGTFVNRLALSGMALFPNQDLEGALLEAAGLPDIEDPDALAAVLGDIPVPIVGPGAAALMPAPAPAPGFGGEDGGDGEGQPPDDAEEEGKPGGKKPPPQKTNFEKMVMAALARRYLKRAGPTMPIGTGRLAKKAATVRKRRLPRQPELPFG